MEPRLFYSHKSFYGGYQSSMRKSREEKIQKLYLFHSPLFALGALES